MMFWRP